MKCYLLLLVSVLLNAVAHASLYGYWYDPVWATKQILRIDPKSGEFEAMCDLSFLPVLSSAPSSAILKEGKLVFYTIDEDSGDISIVKINPLTCDFGVQVLSGLNEGQDEVRDIKYDNYHNKLYMVLPDPNCMQGTLTEIDVATSTVLQRLTTLVDPEGLSQTASLFGKEQEYYYIGLPFPPIDPNYLLNVIDIGTGDSVSQQLVNNDLGLGNMWDTNYTLNVWDSPKGAVVFGAASPSENDNKLCYPSGFYTVDANNGTVSCTYGPISLRTVPIAEIDITNNLFYQLFADKGNHHYLYTYDIAKQSVVAQTACEICGSISVLTFLP